MSQLLTIPAFAGDNYITSYAFANIAGSINGDQITVTVPYNTKLTYWDHKVDVSDGAHFTANTITQIDAMHAKGTIEVISDDGVKRTYTVNINKSGYKAPSVEVGKAKSIKKNGARIPFTLEVNDAEVKSIKLYYYTKKSSSSKSSVTAKESDDAFELTGLTPDTKYYYYMAVETAGKTYETSSKSFTTKAEASKDTPSTSTTVKDAVTTKNETKTPTKGVTGPGTSAVQDTAIRNQWQLMDDKWYYFGEDGYSKTGWFQVDNVWYYVMKGSNELMMNKWQKIDNVWYYFNESGAMVSNQWVGKYYVGESGGMVTDIVITWDGKTYIIDPEGLCMTDTFVQKDGHWQYCKPDGSIAVNEDFTYDNTTYHADSNGWL